MDRFPHDESLFTRLEHKKAQVKSQLAPGQLHLVDDFVMEQVNQSRDAPTVSTVTHQSSPQPNDNISTLEHKPNSSIQHDHPHVDTTLPHPPQYDKDASLQLLLNETANQSTFDLNCPSLEQSTPLVVSPPLPNTSFPPYTKVEHSDALRTALLNPIKTEFESSWSSQLNVVSLKEKFGYKFKKEFKEEIAEHDEDCDCSGGEVKMEVDSEDQLNTERPLKRRRNDQMNVQDGMIRSNRGDGGEGDLIGGELINQEQMESEDEHIESDEGDNSALNQLDSDRDDDGEEQNDASMIGQMEDVEGDQVNGNQDEDGDHQQVNVPADNFVKHIEPDQLGNKFECDFEDCGKRTKYKTNLIRHIRTHTGERPFGCDWCGKAFTTSTQLKYHSRVHSEDRPFVCDMPDCSSVYKNRRSLRKHQLIKHNVL